ncbi:metal-binding protein ZinT [Salibacterium salarium]|uniref:Metal-binding protein ZinT n=1 Tax=Salibacterium salarium TaxID=284579 RepID=A0A3R9QF34_9BACI|nr:metal-binding protein ZinT [Salibacterium salarium]RSL29189.1 metal-binding protein ZinT [Salibacterium salarium]
MKILFAKEVSIIAISSLLVVGCQTSDSSESDSAENEATSTSPASEESSEQTSESHTHETNTGHDHEHDHNQADHEHNHSHADNEEAQQIYDGYFEDSQVEDRPLSDWEGDWQSVYPYLQDGTLDEVFTYKADNEGDMTAEEYKEYYHEGYQTETDRIVIKENTVTFYNNGEEFSGEYVYDGYEILTYDAGNRGVRYIFELTEETEGVPSYIQFSDHSIFPNEANHYHLYWGDDREALLDEVTNWPTYYPSEMDGDDISHEMIAH